LETLIKFLSLKGTIHTQNSPYDSFVLQTDSFRIIPCIDMNYKSQMYYETLLISMVPNYINNYIF